jgi:hypothetical protein
MLVLASAAIPAPVGLVELETNFLASIGCLASIGYFSPLAPIPLRGVCSLI